MERPLLASVYHPFGTDEAHPDVDNGDISELGLSKEILCDELYFPAHPSRDWVRCSLFTSEAGCFRLYLEGKKKMRFLLSAKRFPGDPTFYISLHEDFPDLEAVPAFGFVARLEQQRDRSFLLCLSYCHLCDQKFGFFKCGRSAREREVIAKINHLSRRYSVSGQNSRVEYRSIDVSIPAISKSGKRKVWCPRSFRASNPSLDLCVDVNSAIQTDRNMCQYFTSKAPEWNNDVQTLVVRFQGNRILLPSAKNFLLVPKEEGMAKHLQGEAAVSKQYTKMVLELQQQQQQQQQQMNSYPGSPVASRGSNFSPHPNPHTRKRAPKPPSFYPSHFTASDISVISDNSATGGATPPGEVDDNGSVLSKVTTHTTQSAQSVRTEKSDASKRSESSAPVPPKVRLQRGDSVGTDGCSNSSSLSNSHVHGSKAGRKILGEGAPPARKESRSDSSDFEFIGDGNYRAILQFGKATATKYVLDFKYPLSPLQAFGMALAAFASERHGSYMSTTSETDDL